MADSGKSRRRVPARTPEARENQMINLAVDLAEKQLREGKASSQVITHYLKLATEKERLERRRIEADIQLSEAKIKNMNTLANLETMFGEAINAMKSYKMPHHGEEFDEYH